MTMTSTLEAGPEVCCLLHGAGVQPGIQLKGFWTEAAGGFSSEIHKEVNAAAACHTVHLQ